METAQNSVRNDGNSRAAIDVPVSDCEFDLESHRRFLHRLVQNGGPTVLEYDVLTNSINQAAAAVKRGALTASDLRNVWGRTR